MGQQLSHGEHWVIDDESGTQRVSAMPHMNLEPARRSSTRTISSSARHRLAENSRDQMPRCVKLAEPHGARIYHRTDAIQL